jgi:hypothetical protein
VDLFFVDPIFDVGDFPDQQRVILLGFFLAAFHQLDAKGKAKDTADQIIFPDIPHIRLDFPLGILLPIMVVAELIVCDLVEDFAVLRILDRLGQLLINIVFCDFDALERFDHGANRFFL